MPITNQTEIGVLCEIRDLLFLIAEPQLAERDKVRREALRKIAGKGEKNVKAVLMMDGKRNQATIAKEIPIDVSQLSKLVKALATAKLLTEDSNPTLVIPVSSAVLKEAKK